MERAGDRPDESSRHAKDQQARRDHQQLLAGEYDRSFSMVALLHGAEREHAWLPSHPAHRWSTDWPELPILARLETVGWLTSRWEDIDPRAEGRPTRRYYQLTPNGIELARAALARAYSATARPAWLRPQGE
jgi:hypothetical protein